MGRGYGAQPPAYTAAMRIAETLLRGFPHHERYVEEIRQILEARAKQEAEGK